MHNQKLNNKKMDTKVHKSIPFFLEMNLSALKHTFFYLCYLKCAFIFFAQIIFVHFNFLFVIFDAIKSIKVQEVQ